MSDRELLEAAAKAAGHSETRWFSDDCFQVRRPDRLWEDWSPMTDDGDALRLAVAVGVSINVTKTNIIVRCGDFYDAKNRNTLRTVQVDEAAFIRDAIVRAAAAIGKDMP